MWPRGSGHIPLLTTNQPAFSCQIGVWKGGLGKEVLGRLGLGVRRVVVWVLWHLR